MILDIIFFAFLVGFAVLGFVRGFFKTMVSFFGWFISILAAYLLAKAVANALLTVNMAAKLVGDGSLFDKVYKIVPDGLKSISLDSIRQALNSGQTEEEVRVLIASQATGLVKFAAKMVQNAVCKDMYLNSGLQNAGQVLALELTYHIYVILVGVAFFIVLRIIMMGLSIIFKHIFKERPVKSWERFAGIALGAVRGFAYACIVLMLASYISGVWGAVKTQVEQSKVSVKVTTWVSDTTGKMLSDNLEENKHYKLMMDALSERNMEPSNEIEE